MNPIVVLHTPPAPMDRWNARLNQSPGGPPPGRRSWAMAPGIEDFDVRAPGNLNDDLVHYERMPWVHQSYTATDPDGSGGSTGLVNYASSGPARLSLHMRCETISRMQGTSNTRAQDPNPVVGYGTQDGTNVGRYSGDGRTHGLHSRPPGGEKPATFSRTFVTPQQRPPRQNRLSNSRMAGQSYSQTTIHQGA